jgi:hypothetical protein
MKKLLQIDQQQKKKHPKVQELYNINMTINEKLKTFFQGIVNWKGKNTKLVKVTYLIIVNLIFFRIFRFFNQFIIFFN